MNIFRLRCLHSVGGSINTGECEMEDISEKDKNLVPGLGQVQVQVQVSTLIWSILCQDSALC